jgi:hypothetical protein
MQPYPEEPVGEADSGELDLLAQREVLQRDVGPRSESGPEGGEERSKQTKHGAGVSTGVGTRSTRRGRSSFGKEQVKEALPVKPYGDALEEALEVLGDTRHGYELDTWMWGYKEAAGNVEQSEMRMYYRFDFRPTIEDQLLEYPPRMVEISGLVG